MPTASPGDEFERSRAPRRPSNARSGGVRAVHLACRGWTRSSSKSRARQGLHARSRRPGAACAGIDGGRSDVLEIGTYCGKSAVYLGAAARAAARPVHGRPSRGSEENQAGGTPRSEVSTPRRAKMTRCRSSVARSTPPTSKTSSSRFVGTRCRWRARGRPLGLLFIDGGTRRCRMADYAGWSRRHARGVLGSMTVRGPELGVKPFQCGNAQRPTVRAGVDNRSLESRESRRARSERTRRHSEPIGLARARHRRHWLDLSIRSVPPVLARGVAARSRRGSPCARVLLPRRSDHVNTSRARRWAIRSA